MSMFRIRVHVSHPDEKATCWFSPDVELTSQTGLVEHVVTCPPAPWSTHGRRGHSAAERLSVIRGADGRIGRIRYAMPRHKAANWGGPGRSRKSTQPAATSD